MAAFQLRVVMDTWPPSVSALSRLKLNTMVEEKCPSKSIQSLAEDSSENSSQSILLNHCVATQCPMQQQAHRKSSSNYSLTSRETSGFWQRDNPKSVPHASNLESTVLLFGSDIFVICVLRMLCRSSVFYFQNNACRVGWIPFMLFHGLTLPSGGT